jgi:hypothetical protein
VEEEVEEEVEDLREKPVVKQRAKGLFERLRELEGN